MSNPVQGYGSASGKYSNSSDDYAKAMREAAEAQRQAEEARKALEAAIAAAKAAKDAADRAAAQAQLAAAQAQAAQAQAALRGAADAMREFSPAKANDLNQANAALRTSMTEAQKLSVPQGSSYQGASVNYSTLASPSAAGPAEPPTPEQLTQSLQQTLGMLDFSGLPPGATMDFAASGMDLGGYSNINGLTPEELAAQIAADPAAYEQQLKDSIASWDALANMPNPSAAANGPLEWVAAKIVETYSGSDLDQIRASAAAMRDAMQAQLYQFQSALDTGDAGNRHPPDYLKAATAFTNAGVQNAAGTTTMHMFSEGLNQDNADIQSFMTATVHVAEGVVAVGLIAAMAPAVVAAIGINGLALAGAAGVALLLSGCGSSPPPQASSVTPAAGGPGAGKLAQLAPEQYAAYVNAPPDQKEAKFNELIRELAKDIYSGQHDIMAANAALLSDPAAMQSLLAGPGAEAHALNQFLDDATFMKWATSPAPNAWVGGQNQWIQAGQNTANGIQPVGPLGAAVMARYPTEWNDPNIDKNVLVTKYLAESTPEERAAVAQQMADNINAAAGRPQGTQLSDQTDGYIASMVRYLGAGIPQGEGVDGAWQDASNRLSQIYQEHPELAPLSARQSGADPGLLNSTFPVHGYTFQNGTPVLTAAANAQYQSMVTTVDTAPMLAKINETVTRLAELRDQAGSHNFNDFGLIASATVELMYADGNVEAAQAAQAMLDQAAANGQLRDDIFNVIGVGGAIAGVAALVGGFFTEGATWVLYAAYVGSAAGLASTTNDAFRLYEQYQQASLNVPGLVQVNGATEPTALQWGLLVAEGLLTIGDIALIATAPQTLRALALRSAKEQLIKDIPGAVSAMGGGDDVVQKMISQVNDADNLEYLNQFGKALQGTPGQTLDQVLASLGAVDNMLPPPRVATALESLHSGSTSWSAAMAGDQASAGYWVELGLWDPSVPKIDINGNPVSLSTVMNEMATHEEAWIMVLKTDGTPELRQIANGTQTEVSYTLEMLNAKLNPGETLLATAHNHPPQGGQYELGFLPSTADQMKGWQGSGQLPQNVDDVIINFDGQSGFVVLDYGGQFAVPVSHQTRQALVAAGTWSPSKLDTSLASLETMGVSPRYRVPVPDGSGASANYISDRFWFTPPGSSTPVQAAVTYSQFGDKTIPSILANVNGTWVDLGNGAKPITGPLLDAMSQVGTTNIKVGLLARTAGLKDSGQMVQALAQSIYGPNWATYFGVLPP